jgi:hypothetical protein
MDLTVTTFMELTTAKQIFVNNTFHENPGHCNQLMYKHMNS